MVDGARGDWIEDLELEDVAVKWGFSHFDGRADTYNEPGDHNFVIMLDEATATRAIEQGWAVREKEGYEEGDPPEWHLKVKISYKFEPPRIFLIKGRRKFRAEQSDLADIRRDTCERLDVILTPSRWVNGGNSGITAYVREMYATVKQSRFAERYSDLDDVDTP